MLKFSITWSQFKSYSYAYNNVRSPTSITRLECFLYSPVFAIFHSKFFQTEPISTKIMVQLHLPSTSKLSMYRETVLHWGQTPPLPRDKDIFMKNKYGNWQIDQFDLLRGKNDNFSSRTNTFLDGFFMNTSVNKSIQSIIMVIIKCQKKKYWLLIINIDSIY